MLEEGDEDGGGWMWKGGGGAAPVPTGGGYPLERWGQGSLGKTWEQGTEVADLEKGAKGRLCNGLQKQSVRQQKRRE
jgi:hypothetical protein